MTTEDILSQKLDRLIAALERIAPPEAKHPISTPQTVSSGPRSGLFSIPSAV